MTDFPRLAVCPGSFDPMTNGHVDMIVRGSRLFDRLVVAVLANPSKQPFFPLDERVAIAREVLTTLHDVSNVEVDTFDGLLVDFVKSRRAVAVVRGLRSSSELADEAQMAQMNRHLSPSFETVFLVPAPAVGYISSRLVREISTLGGSIEGLVPPAVASHFTRRHTVPRGIRV